MIFREKPYVSILYDRINVSLSFDKEHASEIYSLFDNLDKGIDYDISIKEKKKKRSIDANGYAWLLIGKIAQELKLTPREVYREQIKNLPTYEIICIQDQAKEMMKEKWESNGIGWMAEEFPSRIDGCTNMRLFYGSSTFNTKEMSQLIDNLLGECKALKIPTMKPEEIERIKSLWRV